MRALLFATWTACGAAPAEQVVVPSPPEVHALPAATPVPMPTPVQEPTPVPLGTIEPLSPEYRAAMTGVTWHAGCPVGLDELRLVRFAYKAHEGGEGVGELVVNKEVAADVLRVMLTLREVGFSLSGAVPVHRFAGSDAASMAADNSSAFNCRRADGGRRFSEHSYGMAIDINPLRNPWVHGQSVAPPGGRAWLARDDRPGVIRGDGPVVAAFREIGWSWGGWWRSSKDYQHFSKGGR